MTALQWLTIVGGLILAGLYVALMYFATGCNGDCAQGRRPCNYKLSCRGTNDNKDAD